MPYVTYVTKHFSLGEAAQRSWFGGPALPYPKAWIEERLRPLFEEMEIIRDVWGKPIILTSVYRSPAFNVAIGGKPKSQHVEGRACDFKVLEVPAAIVHAKVMELIVSRRLIRIRGVGRYPTFCHVDIRQTELNRVITWHDTRRSNIPRR